MPTQIHWFRRDLRLADNPALSAAAATGPVIPLFILDPDEIARMGGASKVWLYHSLKSLSSALGGKLLICEGPAATVLPDLVETYGATQVTWTRRYDPDGIATDQALKQTLKANGTQVTSLNGSLLWEPWDVAKSDGTPYRVFTPFFKRGCLSAPPPRSPLSAPKLQIVEGIHSEIALLEPLLPKIRWDRSVLSGWQPGEAGAQTNLKHFFSTALKGYKAARDIPAQNGTSRLSPHLHFGEISPNQIWHALDSQSSSPDLYHFRSELAWREFSYHLLFRHPDLDSQNLNRKFDPFPWQKNQELLTRWQRGQTGVPIVDAGMRELWQTGYMHNRVRMIVASFLIKNLRLDWRAGLAWFHDTLFDADPANNAASWQWVAGSGADAAPYFRIFNPVTQAQKFDPEALYIKTYVPELGGLSAKHAHAPWLAPEEIQATLEGAYPTPIVDLKESREAALAAFKALPA